MQILVKPIRHPERAPDYVQIAYAVLDYARNKAEPQLKKWGEKAVQGWAGPPDFKTESRIAGGDLIITCEPTGPNAQKWEWVSRGTKKNYPIYPTGHPGSPRHDPAGPKALKYQQNYAPHTSGKAARVKTGGPGTYSGPWVITRGPVTHPGIEPRHFEEGWRSWSNIWFPKGVANAIKKAKIY